MPNFDIGRQPGLYNHYDAGPHPQQARPAAPQQVGREPSAMFKKITRFVKGAIENRMDKAMGEMAYAQQMIDGTGVAGHDGGPPAHHAGGPGPGPGFGPGAGSYGQGGPVHHPGAFHAPGASSTAGFEQTVQELCATVLSALDTFTATIQQNMQGLDAQMHNMSTRHESQMQGMQHQIDALRAQLPGAGARSMPSDGATPHAGAPGPELPPKPPVYLRGSAPMGSRPHRLQRKAVPAPSAPETDGVLRNVPSLPDTSQPYRAHVDSDTESVDSFDDLYDDERSTHRASRRHVPEPSEPSADATPGWNRESDAAVNMHAVNAARDLERNAQDYARASGDGRDQGGRLTR